MTFVGSPFYHIPSSPEDDKDDLFRTCLYCGENWPCEPVMIKRLVIARVIEMIENREAPGMMMAGHPMISCELLTEKIKEL